MFYKEILVKDEEKSWLRIDDLPKTPQADALLRPTAYLMSRMLRVWNMVLHWYVFDVKLKWSTNKNYQQLLKNLNLKQEYQCLK